MDPTQDTTAPFGVRRNAALAPVVVLALLALLAPLLVAAPASADRRKGSTALAVVAGKGTLVSGPYEQSWSGRNYPYSDWATPDGYFLGADPAGRLVVARAKWGRSGEALDVRTYSDQYRRVARHRVSLGKQWELGTAQVAADGGLWVLVGRYNGRESNSRVVVELRRYDADLDLVGRARLRGGFDELGIYQATWSSTKPSIVVHGTTAIVHMARLIYHVKGDPPFMHHQANLTFRVDTTTMTAEPVDGAYSSHSFAQYAAVDDRDLVLLDHGDAYPRAIQLSVLHDYFDATGALSTAATDPTGDPGLDVDNHKIVRFPGRAGNNYTGTTVDGLAVGDRGALTVGVSVPHRHRVHGVRGNSKRLMPNAYVVHTDLDTGKSRWRWLTRYSPRNRHNVVGQPRVVALSGDRFVALFPVERGRRHLFKYVLLDGAGKVLARKTWHKRFRDLGSEPVLVGDRLLWVGSVERHRSRPREVLRGIDVSTPAKPRILHR